MLKELVALTAKNGAVRALTLTRLTLNSPQPWPQPHPRRHAEGARGADGQAGRYACPKAYPHLYPMFYPKSYHNSSLELTQTLAPTPTQAPC